MSTAAVAPALEKPRLPAPLWHTALVLLYVLAPPGWWLGLIRLVRGKPLPYNTGASDIATIIVYTVGVALVCLGLGLHKTPLEELIGKVWTGWKSALRDVAIAAGFWLVARFAAWLVYYLARSHTQRARLVPHTAAELLISIFLAIAAGVAEELIFRGYLQKQFAALCRNAGAGLLIQAALFALFHGYHQSLPTFGRHFLFGLMAGLLAQWRKSLLPGMIGHAWLDAYWDVVRLARIAFPFSLL